MVQSNKKAAAGRGKKAGKGQVDEKGEDVLQAVILADSFQDRFKPLTIDTPRCLLPLANTPLIEYTLEYLAMNGVQEVYVYVGAHGDQVEGYLAASPRWAAGSKINPFQSLDTIRVAQATSLGDFLRDLDKRGIIEGDFVLVHGDLVANVPLDPILERHRARRLANRDAIMTMVLREAEDDHRSRAHGIEPLFVLEAESGRCLEYDEMTPLDSRADRRLMVDPAFFERPADIEVRADLIDTGIDICTPDVLALWTESFDCDLPRKNFLHNVLKDWELNGKLIFTDIVTDGYAARASSLQMYDGVCRDVLGRWTYPLVPETNLVSGHSYRSLRRCLGGNVAAERGVQISPSATVASAVLGLHTSVGTGSVVSGSTLGRRCRIGRNVQIHDCYLWDDVVVGDNVVLTRSVLASGVSVGRGCVLPAGSVLGSGVVVADGFTSARSSGDVKLSIVGRDGRRVADDAAVVGAGGKGAAFRYESDDSDDDRDSEGEEDDDSSDPSTTAEHLQRSLIFSTAHLNLSMSSISSFGSDEDGEHGVFGGDDGVSAHGHSHGDEGGDGDGEGYLGVDGSRNGSRSRFSSFASAVAGGSGGGHGEGGGGRGDGSGRGDGKTAGEGGGSTFHADAVHGLLDALRDESSSDFESARLEFMSLRLAMDASDGALRRAVAAAFARRTAELAMGDDAAAPPKLDPAKAAERAVKGQRGAARFVRDVGIGGGSAAEQVEFVLALQRTLVGLRIRLGEEVAAASGSPAPGTLLAALLQQLYGNDVLEEEGILACTWLRWPLRAFVLRVYENSKGGVPPKSKTISTAPPSWMSDRAVRPCDTRTHGSGWIVRVRLTDARQVDAPSPTAVMANSPGASATRRNVVDAELPRRAVPSNVYHTSNGAVPESV
ncbi:translation initiation factor eif-2b epsilon [Grosmannia clavigera kw1407]|uniref:Mannose-1-phosphate guanyltransferase n=1 Tax=Grosmannia clavigera (strain kw1407 / UAMH 11150) TaxID=655863 RepID=F0XR84_GROCL|nr:translation initiation factor eif-2b epsilon [Grosmannia clavigera kw1407]EFW99941.1 translation initiation factor eif-2b epsilon [Grosmannia clavigera kw1407]